MLYQTLEVLVDMEEDNSLTIKNRYGNYGTVDVKGWRGMIRHHAPPQSETASGANKFASWHAMHDYDFFCYGHFHHWGCSSFLGKPIFRNGSMMGGDGYAESLAKDDKATQIYWKVNSEKVFHGFELLQYED